MCLHRLGRSLTTTPSDNLTSAAPTVPIPASTSWRQQTGRMQEEGGPTYPEGERPRLQEIWQTETTSRKTSLRFRITRHWKAGFPHTPALLSTHNAWLVGPSPRSGSPPRNACRVALSPASPLGPVFTRCCYMNIHPAWDDSGLSWGELVLQTALNKKLAGKENACWWDGRELKVRRGRRKQRFKKNWSYDYIYALMRTCFGDDFKFEYHRDSSGTFYTLYFFSHKTGQEPTISYMPVAAAQRSLGHWVKEL